MPAVSRVIRIGDEKYGTVQEPKSLDLDSYLHLRCFYILCCSAVCIGTPPSPPNTHGGPHAHGGTAVCTKDWQCAHMCLSLPLLLPGKVWLMPEEGTQWGRRVTVAGDSLHREEICRSGLAWIQGRRLSQESSKWMSSKRRGEASAASKASSPSDHLRQAPQSPPLFPSLSRLSSSLCLGFKVAPAQVQS